MVPILGINKINVLGYTDNLVLLASASGGFIE